MAHFYAEAQGSRGATHRLGGKKYGAHVLLKGWDDSVNVYARYDEDQKDNVYTIYFKGRNGEEKLVAECRGNKSYIFYP